MRLIFSCYKWCKKGCVLAPKLFSLLFAMMLPAALSQTNACIKIRYRTDGRVFDLQRLKANSKLRKALVRDSLLADDCADAAHSEEDLQHLADCFSTASKAFRLTVSINKTEVLLLLLLGVRAYRVSHVREMKKVVFSRSW